MGGAIRGGGASSRPDGGYNRKMTQAEDKPPQPVPPDKGQEPPIEQPPDAPGAPPEDPSTPPAGDPPNSRPPKLV